MAADRDLNAPRSAASIDALVSGRNRKTQGFGWPAVSRAGSTALTIVVPASHASIPLGCQRLTEGGL